MECLLLLLSGMFYDKKYKYKIDELISTREDYINHRNYDRTSVKLKKILFVVCGLQSLNWKIILKFNSIVFFITY